MYESNIRLRNNLSDTFINELVERNSNRKEYQYCMCILMYAYVGEGGGGFGGHTLKIS